MMQETYTMVRRENLLILSTGISRYISCSGRLPEVPGVVRAVQTICKVLEAPGAWDCSSGASGSLREHWCKVLETLGSLL
jgi:hypothetical protein